MLISMFSALRRRIPEHIYALWDPEYWEMEDNEMFLDSDDASSFKAKPMILTRAGKFIHLLIVWYILSNFLIC
jgi:hypothetical protein